MDNSQTDLLHGLLKTSCTSSVKSLSLNDSDWNNLDDDVSDERNGRMQMSELMRVGWELRPQCFDQPSGDNSMKESMASSRGNSAESRGSSVAGLLGLSTSGVTRAKNGVHNMLLDNLPQSCSRLTMMPVDNFLLDNLPQAGPVKPPGAKKSNRVDGGRAKKSQQAALDADAPQRSRSNNSSNSSNNSNSAKAAPPKRPKNHIGAAGGGGAGRGQGQGQGQGDSFAPERRIFTEPRMPASRNYYSGKTADEQMEQILAAHRPGRVLRVAETALEDHTIIRIKSTQYASSSVGRSPNSTTRRPGQVSQQITLQNVLFDTLGNL